MRFYLFQTFRLMLVSYIVSGYFRAYSESTIKIYVSVLRFCPVYAIYFVSVKDV